MLSLSREVSLSIFSTPFDIIPDSLVVIVKDSTDGVEEDGYPCGLCPVMGDKPSDTAEDENTEQPPDN